MPKIRVTQVRSAGRRGVRQQGTIRALGLRRIGQSAVHEDKPEIRGMIGSVQHLLHVEELKS
ncbi:50S ribosomal protein L30 [soil metagenome]